MSRYSPLEGIVTSLSPMQNTANTPHPCILMAEIQGDYQQTFYITMDASTYVLNETPIALGDRIIAFYDTMAPMPLIYPPQYKAVAIVKSDQGHYAMLDYFNEQLVNSDNTLVLNLSENTLLRLPNGQPYMGTPGNQYLLVLYTNTTRSIPAQTTPSEITVFCN